MPFVTSDRFARLAPAERDRLEAISKLDQFGAGAELASFARPSEWLYLLETGAVETRVSGPSGELTLCKLGPGDLVGELDSFVDPAGMETVGLRRVATEDTIVRAIAKNTLLQEMKARRPLALDLLFVYARSISEKIRQANDVALRVGPPKKPLPGGPPHLGAADVQWLAMLGAGVEHDASAVIVAEGETTRSFYVIASGRAEVRKNTPSGERVLATFGPGDMFGVMAFVDGKPRSATVASLGPASFVRVEPEALEQALEVNFTVGFKFLGTLCQVLGRTFKDTAQNVAAALT